TSLANNGPFRGTKGTLFEGGLRVPCIVRAPGRIAPGTVSDQASITMDLTASILAMAGAQAPEDRPTDGIDILGHVAEGKDDRPRTLAWRYRRGDRTWRAIADGRLKYVELQDGGEAE